jgi:hypothetical protein
MLPSPLKGRSACARLAGARTDVVVRTHHLGLQRPEVIREARRILMEHAGINPTSGTDHGDLAREAQGSGREK